jgi:hypothetical protein
LPYRYVKLFCPGLTALMALGMLDALQEKGTIKPLTEMQHNGVEYLHTLVEILRYVIGTVTVTVES